MLALRIIFIILALVSIGCLVLCARQKRRNTGFLVVAAMIAAADIESIITMNVQNAKEAGKVLLPYYILHAWFLFALLFTVVLIDRFRKFLIAFAVMAFACLYQTYLVVSQYLGARVFSFQKRMYFRRAWWVATDSKNTGLLFSYRSYRITTYINLFIVFLVLILCIRYCHKIFRTRYISLSVMVAAYAAVEVLKVHFSLPIWIPCLAYNLMSVLCLYLTGVYADRTLRDWSLDSFANDMSDGLILYDKHNDLIHMNDMVRETLDESLLEEFRDKSRLESWLKDVSDPDNNNIVTYESPDRQYYFKVNIRELGGRSNGIGTLYILHDTTDSMLTIKAMQQANDELERASRMKSDFLANMSHEIRTPMNAVIGMAEIAMRERDQNQVTDYLMQIQNSGKNLLNIINDILDYSKIESGKMEIIEEEYYPIEEYSDIAKVLATRIGDKKLDLFVSVESEIPHILRGDAMRIRQVLINLANNAIKFTNEGMVIIRIKCEPLLTDTVNIIFNVVDTGIGIKQEDLDKLFVSFTQVDSRRNRAVEGTGLGLAISQRLVEAMGGSIGVESEYGKGSDFWFTVPQRVVDGSNDVSVNEADGKAAFVVEEREDFRRLFISEMEELKLSAGALSSLYDYEPSGKKDYIFLDEFRIDNKAREFFKKNPDVNVVVLVPFDSELDLDEPNLHLLRKPLTTIGMVNSLNDKYDKVRSADEGKLFRIDFTAPDAKVLVVDDNAINLTIAEGLMAPLKLQFDSANSGQEAIDKVLANDYDLVFMDHMMPGIDGVDAAKTIKASEGYEEKPVIIALSANAMEEARRLFEAAGMCDFVAKPIDIRDLTTKIKKWLPPEKIIESDGSEEDFAQQAGVKVQSDELDIDTAVNALGSAALYDKIAEEYYRSGEDKLNGILNAYNTEDWDDYTIRVHALKSSSRQIGAMELGSMAEALEKAGKAGDIDTIRSDTDATIDKFRHLLNELEPYYAEDETDEADKPPIDKAVLEEQLTRLEEACDNLDMDAMEEVGDTLKTYSYEEEVRAMMNDLYRAISEIDTDTCMEIAGKLRNLGG